MHFTTITCSEKGPREEQQDAAGEWVQNRQNFARSEIEINERLYRILERAFQDVPGFGKRNGLWMREAALAIGVNKVIQAKRARGLYP